MKTLTYSSDLNTKLNSARRNLYVAKYMLGCANREPHKYDKSLWMWAINTRRNELRKLAHEIRAKLPAQDVYRVELKGESKIRFAEYEYAHSQMQANRRVSAIYGDLFEVVSV